MRHGDQTHCARGHPFDAANTRVRTDMPTPQRVCIACDRRRAREYQRRRRTEQVAA